MLMAGVGAKGCALIDILVARLIFLTRMIGRFFLGGWGRRGALIDMMVACFGGWCGEVVVVGGGEGWWRGAHRYAGGVIG